MRIPIIPPPSNDAKNVFDELMNKMEYILIYIVVLLGISGVIVLLFFPNSEMKTLIDNTNNTLSQILAPPKSIPKEIIFTGFVILGYKLLKFILRASNKNKQ